jgi:hypothetical protein
MDVIRVPTMTQEERWLAKYNVIMAFIAENHRRPSKYKPEERNAWNWLKANRKVMNASALKEPRFSKFKELLVLVEEHKSVNQYV